MAAADAGVLLVQFSGIESGGKAEVVSEALPDQSVDAESELAPGGRDDARFHLVALHAIVGGRFVRFVEDAERNEEQPSLYVDRIAEFVVQIRLLHLDFTTIPCTGDRVLDL